MPSDFPPGAKEGAKRGRKKLWANLDPKARKRRIIWAVVAAVVLVACILPSTITGFVSYSFYKHDSQMANDGIAQLEKGLTLLKGLTSGQLNPQTTTQAKASFMQAHNLFAQVNSDLAGLPGVLSAAPHYGGELQTAQRLVPIAVEGAQMGVLGSDALNILIARVSDPFGANSQGLTATDVKAINADFAQVKTLFATMVSQINQLSPSDLQFNAKLSTEFQKFHAALPTIQQDITDVGTLLSLVPALLGVGAPANYLVEMLDSSELRPGGGFIGNYGMLTLTAGKLTGLHVTDVDLLDRPFEFAGYSIPFPSGYPWFNLGVNNWSVRDSNLDADFPTDARYAEKNYQIEATQNHLMAAAIAPIPAPAPIQPQGLLAITPFLIERMLDITGPIYVPEFKETINSSNLIDRIHYHQLGQGHGSDYIPDPGSLSSQRKAFTGYLFKHFMDKVKADAGTKRADFVKLLLLSFQRKDVQLYLNSSQGEAVLKQLHQASTIDAPATGDSLFIVDANITGNKSNIFINYSLQDTVTVDTKGNATHHATLTYNWPVSTASSNNNYGNNLDYHDYIRIYAPPKASLQSQDGWIPSGQSSAFGRTVFAGLFIMNYGTKASVTLTWTVPNAAYQDAQGWHYSFLDQHQAGLIWTANTQVTLPSCAKVGSLTNLKAGPNTTYGVQGYLSIDTTYGINYTC